MSELPTIPVTLSMIKETLEETPRARSMNFVFTDSHHSEIDENVKLLAQEFDKELNITPLVVQGLESIDALSKVQLSAAQVIILLSTEPVPIDTDVPETVCHMRRALSNVKTFREVIESSQDQLVIVMQMGTLRTGLRPWRVDFGEASLYACSVVKFVNPYGTETARSRSPSTEVKYPAILDAILNLELK